jgi:hypothetical protein
MNLCSDNTDKENVNDYNNNALNGNDNGDEDDEETLEEANATPENKSLRWVSLLTGVVCTN